MSTSVFEIEDKVQDVQKGIGIKDRHSYRGTNLTSERQLHHPNVVKQAGEVRLDERRGSQICRLCIV
jgi:hypothetical protein